MGHSCNAELCYCFWGPRLGDLARQWGNLRCVGDRYSFLRLAFLYAWPTFAATARRPDQKSSKGAIMLSRGQGYAPITGPTTAKTGDMVLAFSGGHAKGHLPRRLHRRGE